MNRRLGWYLSWCAQWPSGQVRPTLLTPVYLHYDTAAVKPDTSTFTFTTQYPVVTQQCWNTSLLCSLLARMPLSKYASFLFLFSSQWTEFRQSQAADLIALTSWCYQNFYHWLGPFHGRLIMTCRTRKSWLSLDCSSNSCQCEKELVWSDTRFSF